MVERNYKYVYGIEHGNIRHSTKPTKNYGKNKIYDKTLLIMLSIIFNIVM